MEEINGMNYPRLEINLRRLEHNARLVVQKFAKYGVTVMGVNKVFNGLSETGSAMIRAGIDVVAESRVSNLKKLQHLPCQKCLLRTPSPSEIVFIEGGCQTKENTSSSSHGRYGRYKRGYMVRKP